MSATNDKLRADTVQAIASLKEALDRLPPINQAEFEQRMARLGYGPHTDPIAAALDNIADAIHGLADAVAGRVDDHSKEE